MSTSEVLACILIHDTNQGANWRRMHTQAVATLDKHRHLHERCLECRVACRRALGIIKRGYYSGLRQESRLQWNGGHRLTAVLSTGHALLANPNALVETPCHWIAERRRRAEALTT